MLVDVIYFAKWSNPAITLQFLSIWDSHLLFEPGTFLMEHWAIHDFTFELHAPDPQDQVFFHIWSGNNSWCLLNSAVGFDCAWISTPSHSFNLHERVACMTSSAPSAQVRKRLTTSICVSSGSYQCKQKLLASHMWKDFDGAFLLDSEISHCWWDLDPLNLLPWTSICAEQASDGVDTSEWQPWRWRSKSFTFYMAVVQGSSILQAQVQLWLSLSPTKMWSHCVYFAHPTHTLCNWLYITFSPASCDWSHSKSIYYEIYILLPHTVWESRPYVASMVEYLRSTSLFHGNCISFGKFLS